MGVTGQKKSFFVKNTFFCRVSIRIKNTLFVVKQHFCVSTRFYSLDGITSDQTKHLFVIKKHIFACPRVPSSLEGIHSGQKNVKNMYFQSKTHFCVSMGLLHFGRCPLGSIHVVPVVWKVLIWVKKTFFVVEKNLFVYPWGPLQRKMGHGRGLVDLQKGFFLTTKNVFFD